MNELSRRFDPYIPQMGADDLKRIVRLYGGEYKMQKQKCIDFLIAALAKPETVRQAIANLEPFELLSLALVKQLGGAADYNTLAAGVLAAGVRVPDRLFKRDGASEFASHLVQRGLFLNDGHSIGRFYSSYERVQLFSDPRLLAHVGAPQAPPMVLPVAQPPNATLVRLPPTVMLDLLGFLQTLDQMGGLGLTQKGELRANDLSKFRKALQWPKEDLDVDGLIFKDAVTGLLNALRHSDFLALTTQNLILRKPVAEVATRSYSEQVATLVNGFLRVTEWNESTNNRWQSYGNQYQAGRLALLMALSSLPVESDKFYTIDAFDEALFARIGENFSVEGKVYKFLSTYGKSAAEIREIEAQWLAEKRAKWLKSERPWIEAVLSSWLYYLGMVELGLDGKRVVAFRLTALGKAVLHPTKAITVGAPVNPIDDGPVGSWVVQPNFDVIVYLDRTTPLQLAFLERHAERTQAQQYTAHYRLTREAVYRGLESGTTFAAFIEELARHAQSPLPQNVTVELTEWAGLRDQVVLNHRAQLLEFATPAARQAAQAANLAGTPVGDRFLLLEPGVAKAVRQHKVIGPVESINYTTPLPKVLQVDESGLLQCKAAAPDLLIEAQLDRWAERGATDQWQLTAARVTTQIKTGARIDELIVLLQERLTHSLPPFLELALRNWAGRAKGVEFESLVVLHSNSAIVLTTLRNSKRLQPYLRGQLTENVLLFDAARLNELREVLNWAGFKLSDLEIGKL